MMPPQPQWFGERDKGASPFRAANFPNTNTMKETREARLFTFATGFMQLEFDGENYFKLNPWRDIRVDGKKVPNPDYGKKIIVSREKIDSEMDSALKSFAQYGCD